MFGLKCLDQMNGPGSQPFYICVWVGLIQNPTHSLLFLAVWSGSWWIRINPTHLVHWSDPYPSDPWVFGPRILGLPVFGFLSISWAFLVMCTPVFAIWTSCVSWLLYEIPKIVMRSWYICDCFVIFYMWKWIKIWQVLISHLIGISCVFMNVLACLLIQIFVLWFWWISTWFHGDLPLFS